MWHVADLGHIAVEARRPCEAQGIVAGRDEVAFVFESSESGSQCAETGDNFALAIDGLLLGGCTMEGNLHRLFDYLTIYYLTIRGFCFCSGNPLR